MRPKSPKPEVPNQFQAGAVPSVAEMEAAAAGFKKVEWLQLTLNDTFRFLMDKDLKRALVAAGMILNNKPVNEVKDIDKTIAEFKARKQARKPNVRQNDEGNDDMEMQNA